MAQMIFQGNTRTSPDWRGDFGGREHILAFPAKLDPTQFQDQGGIQVALTASAAGGATSIAVAALTLSVLASTILIAQGDTLIPAGTALVFNAAAGKIAVTTADAHYGDTAITVAPLPTALSGTETADYSKYGTEFIPSGTAVGRTYVQRAAGGLFLPADPVNHDEIYLTYFDLNYASVNNDFEPYRPGSLVKENYLPNYATILAPGGTASALMIRLRTIYRTEIGQD